MVKLVLGVFIGVVLGGLVLIVGYDQYASYKVKSALEAVEQAKLEESKRKEQRKIEYQEYLVETYAKRCKMQVEKKYKAANSIEIVHKTEKLVAVNFVAKSKSHHARCYIGEDGAVRQFELVQ